MYASAEFILFNILLHNKIKTNKIERNSCTTWAVRTKIKTRHTHLHTCQNKLVKLCLDGKIIRSTST